jgi:pimeloyl-ACP methyl ester carboxylesterase
MEQNSGKTHATNEGANGSYAEVHGLQLYYEIHGAGEPLILLHGGLGAIQMFGEVLPSLAQNRRVVAVDLQAHGRTADIDRPLSFELMAGDIVALIKHLGIEEADVMGYSLGGGVALRTCAGYLAYPFHNREVHGHAGNLNETYLNVDCKEKHE